MADTYKNFGELSAAEDPSAYRIQYVDKGTGILIMAPHGGGIEPGTTPAAKSIAGNDYSLYTFDGKLPTGNAKLHITSTRFDEPTALEAVGKVDSALALHGAKGEKQAIYMGGIDTDLKDKIAAALIESGFTLEAPPAGQEGTHPENIVNRTRLGKGVQIELTKALRDALKGEELAEKFTNTVRAAIEAVYKKA